MINLKLKAIIYFVSQNINHGIRTPKRFLENIEKKPIILKRPGCNDNYKFWNQKFFYIREYRPDIGNLKQNDKPIITKFNGKTIASDRFSAWPFCY